MKEGAHQPALEFGLVTLFPEMFSSFTDYGVTGRAVKNGLVSVNCWNPRDFTHDRHRTVDDRPFGGGPGMLMKVQPLRDAISAAKAASERQAKVIYLSPQGRKLDQQGVVELAGNERLIFVCGRYEGIDERLIETEIDEEWSLGDIVLSGGELAAMSFMDAISRLVPGVLGHAMSSVEDSFFDGLLDCPHYTRPEVLDDLSVPDVLLSGHHENIRKWREMQAIGRTWQRRPDLLEGRELTKHQQTLLDKFKSEQSSRD
ncbi:tRNA (guanosine(37)-N1)-methyltransferase TrmD [Reinekea marinisedimentorum]|uniref:tRNA (guanine-N(1)-)-methyltransferase n=1 Tax=Reinekea marinisedimentorum TaxID=230495 RepID=A0A4R3I5G6_9GAMM|nr:tRNA (guanosine(37)-N1)-methyltransferase TrmD [Reinekea marinisedimentorum]TCS40025.1 tRNA (guanine37-N1)-methyltransferase [Reinekea marinisedimentorum]